MGWSLDYRKFNEPKLLDDFFLAVGRSLYLANAFESKCKYVLRLATIAEQWAGTRDSNAVMNLAGCLKDQLLGQTLKAMKGFPDFRLADIETLEMAKEARNFIAHQGADIGQASVATADHILEHIIVLREQLRTLAIGDNLVSRWIYEIEHKDAAPQLIQLAYPEWVEEWVFGHIEIAYQDDQKPLLSSCGNEKTADGLSGGGV